MTARLRDKTFMSALYGACLLTRCGACLLVVARVSSGCLKSVATIAG
jgi:hypothetical protein